MVKVHQHSVDRKIPGDFVHVNGFLQLAFLKVFQRRHNTPVRCVAFIPKHLCVKDVRIAFERIIRINKVTSTTRCAHAARDLSRACARCLLHTAGFLGPFGRTAALCPGSSKVAGGLHAIRASPLRFRTIRHLHSFRQLRISV